MGKLENLLHNYSETVKMTDDKYAPLTAVIANSLDAYNMNITGLSNTLKDNGVYHKEIASVDLGDLDWNYTASGSGVAPFFNANISNMKYLGKFDTYSYPYTCSEYPTVFRTTSTFVDKSLALDGTVTNVANQIEIKDSAYSDANAFKAAVKGIRFYYILDTPVDVRPVLTVTEKAI